VRRRESACISQAQDYKAAKDGRGGKGCICPARGCCLSPVVILQSAVSTHPDNALRPCAHTCVSNLSGKRSVLSGFYAIGLSSISIKTASFNSKLKYLNIYICEKLVAIMYKQLKNNKYVKEPERPLLIIMSRNRRTFIILIDLQVLICQSRAIIIVVFFSMEMYLQTRAIK
jgi:hypothetical protein